MGRSVLAPVLLSLGVYFMLQGSSKLYVLASGSSENGGLGHRRGVSLLFSPRSPGAAAILRARLEPSLNELLEEAEEFSDVNKRQFDDYGHMRFGKRGEAEEKFDDYGHMRFGRNHA